MLGTLGYILSYAFGWMAMLEFDWTVSIPAIITGASAFLSAGWLGVKYARRVCAKLDQASADAATATREITAHASRTDQRLNELRDELRAIQNMLIQKAINGDA